MILTGQAIHDAVQNGEIIFDPFNASAINPNSINYRLGETIFQVSDEAEIMKPCLQKLRKHNGKYLLKKGCLYLGHTLETIGSDVYVTSLIGRSSVGRLGLFVQVSANLGHVGAIHRWTLELVPTLDIYVYPRQIIGQVSFWKCMGSQEQYSGWFGRHNQPVQSKLHNLNTTSPEFVNDFNGA